MSEPTTDPLLTGNMPAGRLTPDAGLRAVARQAAANLEALQTLSQNYEAALASSVADRAALHTQVDAASSSGTAAIAAAAAAQTTATGARTVADKAAADLAAFITRRDRTAPPVTVPAMLSLLNGAAAVDVTVTWTSPWPDTAYDILPVLDVPSSLMGKVTVTVKSKATASAVLTVTTSALLAASSSTVRAVSVSIT